MQKKVLATAIAAAMCAPFAAEAVSVKFSGHVHRVIKVLDDGQASDIKFEDGGGSRTRLRWKGSSDIGNGMKAGAYAEIAVARNVSGGGSTVLPKNNEGGDQFGVRQGNIWFSGNFGEVRFGFTTNSGAGTYEAMDGTSAYDPAGNNLISGTDFVNAAGATTGIGVDTVFNSLTYGRDNMIKYTSPKFGPVQVAADFGQNSQYGFQVRVNTKLAGSQFKVKGGYRSEEAQSGFDQWHIAGGMKFSQGTSVSLTYTERDRTPGGGLENQYWHARIGHSFGNNVVALGYYNSEDMAVANDEGTEWSATLLHKINKARVHLYATYSNFEYDHPTIATQDINQFILGSRVFF